MRYVLSVMAVAVFAACDGTGSGTLVNPGGLIGDGGGAPSGGGSGVSCTFTSTCEQVTGAVDPDQRTSIETGCTAYGGAFASGSCSRTGAVPGYCTISNFSFGSSVVDGSFKRYYYTAAGFDAASAESSCTGGGGTWTP